MDTGYIRLNRKLTEWRWFRNPVVLSVWIWLLLNANWKDKDFENVTIHRGEIAVSYQRIADAVGITYKQARSAINKLQTTQEVGTHRYSKFLVISILNYDQYQSDGQTKGNQRAIKGQSKGNNLKIIKREKGKNIYMRARARGSMSNIYLSEDQYQSFSKEYPDDATRLIDELSEYKAKTGKEYEDDYPALVSFARRQGLVKESDKPDYRIENEFEITSDPDGYEVAKTIRYRVYPDGRKEVDTDGT